MSKEFKRVDRVAEMIQRKLAQIIQQEVKDPRLPRLTTVSAVKVSADIANARVYVSVLGDEEKIKTTLSILNNASSFIRTALARSVKLRAIPQLTFVYDESLVYGNRLSRLIDEVAPDDDSEEQE